MSDRAPYLYKTTDYGKTWQKITNGIRENDFAYVIREDPVRPGLLYAGTETGAYVSFDAGASWQSLQRNLPTVAVTFMQVKNNDLVVATHGRSFWILDNLSALRQITPRGDGSPGASVRGRAGHAYLGGRGSAGGAPGRASSSRTRRGWSWPLRTGAGRTAGPGASTSTRVRTRRAGRWSSTT